MVENVAGGRAQVVGLFPTPIMLVKSVITDGLLKMLAERIDRELQETNSKSDLLSHTKAVEADQDEIFREAAARIRPHMGEFGKLLFGEKLTWRIKEIWINAMLNGGAQALHNHANSFISGVVYLNDSHPGSGTVFHKALGGSEYSFVNQNAAAETGPFNAKRWQVPPVAAGDMVLFPSYVLHEVPTNQGERRLTMAFNALPDRLDSYGYAVKFS